VLRTQELGETDLIVSLLAESGGQVRGVARGARKSRKRFGGLLEPLTHVRATWTEKEGRDLHRIDSLEGVRSFAAMQSDPALQAACAVLAEVAGMYSREGQADARGFKLLGAVLDALEQCVDPFVVIRYFEYWTLRLQGLLPDLAICSQCSNTLPAGEAPRVSRSGVLCADCHTLGGRTAQRIGREEREVLQALRHSPPTRLNVRAVVARAGRPLELLLRGTLESFAETRFRSYRHLAAAAGHGPIQRRRG
jgi:DNA repair protein RecO (recombination protein O)